MGKSPTSYGEIAGNPGNRSGSVGRPDEAIRAKARESWGKRLYRLEKIVDGAIKKASVSDWIAAMREIRAVGFADRQEVQVQEFTPEERVERLAVILNGARKRIANGNGAHKP